MLLLRYLGLYQNEREKKKKRLPGAYKHCMKGTFLITILLLPFIYNEMGIYNYIQPEGWLAVVISIFLTKVSS